MASNNFRDSIGSLGWSRREEAPVSTSQQSGLLSSIQSLNPFQDRGYVQLPTTEGPGAPLPQPNRREEEEGWLVRKSILFKVVHHPGLFPSLPSRRQATRLATPGHVSKAGPM